MNRFVAAIVLTTRANLDKTTLNVLSNYVPILEVAKTKREAVIYALDAFIDWYNLNNNYVKQDSTRSCDNSN